MEYQQDAPGCDSGEKDEKREMVEVPDMIVRAKEWLGPDFDFAPLLAYVTLLVAFLAVLVKRDTFIATKAKETGEKKSVLTCSHVKVRTAAGVANLTLTFVSRGETSLTDVDIRIWAFADQGRHERIAAGPGRVWFTVFPKGGSEKCIVKLTPIVSGSQSVHICCAYDYKLFNGEGERAGECFDVAIPSSGRPVLMPLPAALCRDMLRG